MRRSLANSTVSKTASHLPVPPHGGEYEPWELGKPGKGWYNPDTHEVEAWAVVSPEERGVGGFYGPYHNDNHSGIGRPLRPIWIAPDGVVGFRDDTWLPEGLLAAHPDFKKEDSWTFRPEHWGKLATGEPRLHWLGTPAYVADHSMLFNPDSNEIFIGDEGIHHANLYAAFDPNHSLWPAAVYDGEFMVYTEHANPLWDPIYRYFSDLNQALVGEPLGRADENGEWKFGATPQWKIIQGERTFDTSSFGDQQPGEYDHNPIIVFPEFHTAYIGNTGTHHMDLSEEFKLDDYDSTSPNYAMTYPRDLPGDPLVYDGVEYPGLIEALSAHLGQPIEGATNSWDWNYWNWGSHQSAFGDSQYNMETMEWNDYPDWEPGRYGKGVLFRSEDPEVGEYVVTWAVDETGTETDPGYHHWDMIDRFSPDEARYFFQIEPDGAIEHWAGGGANPRVVAEANEQRVLELDSRLKPSRESQRWFAKVSTTPQIVEADESNIPAYALDKPDVYDAYKNRRAWLYYPSKNTIFVGGPAMHHEDVMRHFGLGWEKDRTMGVIQKGESRGFGAGETGVRFVGVPQKDKVGLLDLLAEHYGLPANHYDADQYDFFFGAVA